MNIVTLPAFCSVDFESVIASDVSASAITGLPFDAATECSTQLANLAHNRLEIDHEMPRCLAFVNDQLDELKETPEARSHRIKAQYPARIKVLVDRALARGEMDVSCLEYSHYPSMFSACRSDARRTYLERVAAPDFVPASCSQLALRRNLKMDTMSSMDYTSARRPHSALFVGEILRIRGSELTVGFGGRDALIRVMPTTRSYRHAPLAVGNEIDGFGVARREGMKVSLKKGVGETLDVINAACIQ